MMVAIINCGSQFLHQTKLQVMCDDLTLWDAAKALSKYMNSMGRVILRKIKKKIGQIFGSGSGDNKRPDLRKFCDASFSLNFSQGLSPIIWHFLLGVSNTFQTNMSKIRSLPDHTLPPTLAAGLCFLPQEMVPASCQSWYRQNSSYLGLSPPLAPHPLYHQTHFFFIYWSVVDLPCYVSFMCMAKWFSFIYTFFFRFLSIIGYYKILNVVSCAIQ